MSDIPFTGWGQYYGTGFIDIDATAPLLPDTAQIVFPPIDGQTDVDTYVNTGNLSGFLSNNQSAALDHHVTFDLPFAACDIGDIATVGFGPALDAAWSAGGGALLASRVTCEGFGSVFGVPTVFRYHVYILHDQLQLFVGLAILIGIVAIALNQGASERLANFFKPFSPGGAAGGATGTLLLFGVVGAVFAIAIYLTEKRIAGPGQYVTLPSPPGIPSIGPPAISGSVGAGAGPVRGTVGVTTPGAGGGGRYPSRRRR
jgi:hypothetical protein